MASERIYILGVCGSAMGGVAGLLAAAGNVVGGSDTQFYDPMGTKLREWGVTTYTGWDAANIDAFRPDRVVVGNVVRSDNPEMARVKALGLPFESFPEMMERTLLVPTENIVVTGTHGKTTTSSLLAWLLEQAGQRPSWFIGGIPENLGKNFNVSGGRWFVLEGDEYDTAFWDKGPKFLHYRPTHGLVLNVELDHVDIYPSFEAVKDAFRRFASLVPEGGTLTACAEDGPAMEVTEGKAAPRLMYGNGSPVAPVDATYHADHATFSIRTPDGVHGPFTTQLTGRHNVLNACAAYALWRHLGFDDASFARGLASFTGVRKRLEAKGTYHGAQVFEDFGHHPTEIAATLAGLRLRFPGTRLLVAFRAESNTSRTPLFEPRYVEAFTGADRVFLAATLAKRDYLKTERHFDPALVVEALTARGVRATHHADPATLATAVRAEAGPDDLVILFSSRGMDGLAALLTAP
jgi:UDP-N-acetylmuramate: L-alanyl-gamma-D-glutamyl-meso-diaminopimelate ligase